MIMVDEKAAHMNWAQEKFADGQIVRVEIAGAYEHYHCPISRTVFIGNDEKMANSQYHLQREVEFNL